MDTMKNEQTITREGALTVVTSAKGKMVFRRCKACVTPFKHPHGAKNVGCPSCHAVHKS